MGGGGRGHGPPPGKLQIVIYFQAENWYELPSGSNPPPLELHARNFRQGGGGGVQVRQRFFLCFSFSPQLILRKSIGQF